MSSPIDTIREALEFAPVGNGAALAALTEVEHQLAARTHRCQFPACVDGVKPEFCGHCGDAERAEAAEQRASDALNGLTMAAGELERERERANALADALREIAKATDGNPHSVAATIHRTAVAALDDDMAARAALDRQEQT